MILDDCHECTKCGQLFTNEEALEKHTKAKHPDRSVLKRYKCDICSYSSDQKSSLEQHKPVHLKENRLNVQYVRKSFQLNQIYDVTISFTLKSVLMNATNVVRSLMIRAT